ncbi:putative glutamate receptor-like protein [Dinothrombium tinctorium]|uniref:Putative glutamate receptor-like protein n=1 Tax=Dinothrombium tinctorium TaxID=1965070 RepID=A0A3S3NWY2_9ACAR|nr:putative glutamate receptor-like protein [Dinothrombium tinctorium]
MKIRLCLIVLFLFNFGKETNAAKNNKKPTFRITTSLSAPYVVSIRDPSTLNEQQTELNIKLFDGYLIDLLNILAKEVGFAYNISLVKDGMYGIADADGEWRGMVGEVYRGVISLN